MIMTAALLIVAILAAALGFMGFSSELAYAIFYATLGLLGIHLLLSAVEEDAKDSSEDTPAQIIG